MGLRLWAPVPGKYPCHRFLLLYDQMTTMVRACCYNFLFRELKKSSEDSLKNQDKTRVIQVGQ